MNRFVTWFLSLILGILSLVITSCREDVILPENLALNINEPVQKNELDSYSFMLNARSISINIASSIHFSSSTSRISISIKDYSSGSVVVSIADHQMSNRFNYLGSDDERFYTESLDGFVPVSISISSVNFSGIFQVELHSTF